MRWSSLLLISLITLGCSSDDGDDAGGGDASGDSSSDSAITGSDGDGDDGPGATGSDAQGQDGDDGAAGTGGEDGDDGDGATPPVEGTSNTGCDGASFLDIPADPSVRGPWPVGNKTLRYDAAGSVGNIDVWYPAVPGSEEGGSKKTWDFIQEWTPESERSKIPEDENKLTECNCYVDLPIDEEHGPYPVIAYIHGTSGFRITSLAQVEHWASRGFIVIAADHLGMYMPDWLAGTSSSDECVGTQGASNSDFVRFGSEAGALIDAAYASEGEWAFLKGMADTERAGATGHSAGGVATSGGVMHPKVEVAIPMQGWLFDINAPNIKSAVGLAALDDAIAVYPVLSTQFPVWGVPKKRLVGVSGAGHLMVTQLCGFNNDNGKNILDVGQEYGVCGVDSVASLFDCSPEHIPETLQTEIVNYVTAAAFEETLHCRASMTTAFDELQQRYPEVGEFRNAP